MVVVAISEVGDAMRVCRIELERAVGYQREYKSLGSNMGLTDPVDEM